MTKTAVICVDVQNDFLPGGALGVPDGDQVIEPLLRAAEHADFVVATRDYHPLDHVSFAGRGGTWPPHCIRGRRGAFINRRIEHAANLIVSKGIDRDREAYSAFDGTNLACELRARSIDHVVVGGLATDYCVRATVLDALKEGFTVEVLTDGIKAVNIHPDDGDNALVEMEDAGARLVTTADA